MGKPHRAMPSDSPRIQEKRVARMARIDELTPDVRSCVHDYGLNVVGMLMGLGITESRHIRHVVETILDEFSPTRGSYSSQGIKSSAFEETHP